MTAVAPADSGNMKKLLTQNRHSRGIAAIYAVISVVAMMGMCSLAVDLGRVVTAKTELGRAAEAACLRGGVLHVHRRK